jgi:hypothetical protein
MFKRFIPLASASLFLFLTGCASTPPMYDGISFPATDKAQVVFQEKDVPAQCTVFAHLIVHTPAGLTGERIGDGITGFAESKGADLVFVGLSRKTSDNASKDFEFFSYGPREAYKFGKDWFGWKFGYTDWENGGSVIGFGYDSWHDASGIYDFSLKVQTVLLRCRTASQAKTK